MSRDLSVLDPAFLDGVLTLLELCRKDGYTMVPYQTLRLPREQAKLWRQSRPTHIINRKIKELRDNGAYYLAECLSDVGPQNGRHVTNAIPGLSWHQWGEAVDCYWELDGKANWSTKLKVRGANGYRRYAARAESLGLVAGGLWAKFPDFVHVQLRSGSAARMMNINEIDDKMRGRFRFK